MDNNNCQGAKRKAPIQNRPHGRGRLVIMANTVTYAVALKSAIDFLKSNGYDNEDVIAKLEKLASQKATKSNTGKKSPARAKNEELAQILVQTMRDANVDEIRAAWVRDNVEGINTVPKAVAVLNVANDMGLLITEKRAKSATRNELIYKLA